MNEINEGGEGDNCPSCALKALKEEEDHDDANVIPQGKLFVFGVALFLHSFIDGLTIGVFKQISQVAILASSVTIHKIPVAFTLGFTFAKSNMKWSDHKTKAILISFLFSSPLGVLFGAVASELLYKYALLIIQSISSGTFLYLSAVDLMVHEFQHSQITMTTTVKISKVVALLAGWGFVIFLITKLPAHEG